MVTQAGAPAQPAQVQTPEPQHPIHEETATINALTAWVQNNPDNDPHTGTDLEEPPRQQPQGEPQEPAPAQEASATQEADTVEFDEDSPVFELEYKTETGKETKKLSLKELREGWMAKQDYHRNIQKVKAQETALNEQVKQAELKATQEALGRLETYKQAVIRSIAPELNGVDLNKLAQEDPAKAQQIFFRQIQVNQLLQSIEAEQRQASAKLQGEQQAAMSAAIEKSRQTLSSDIKDWNDELYTKVLDGVAKDYGFEARDVAQVVDARLIKVFHDAFQYRQLQQAKPQVAKRVVAVPKVVKPGSAEQPSPAKEAAVAAAERLEKSGKGEDFVRWYMAKHNLKG